MATYGDENLLLSTDYTQAIYEPVVIDQSVTNIEGVAAPPVTTVNGGGGGQATGPVITISGGTTGMNFNASGNTISLSGTLDVDNGGTGFSSYTQGDLLYASGATAFSKLAKDTNATRYLSNIGASNNPAWAQIDLTNGVTGVLPIANGGTNANTAAGARSNLSAAVSGDNTDITKLLGLSGGLRLLGRTSSAADPTTTELPADKDVAIHKNTTSGDVFLAYNDGGATIKKVLLT